MTPPCADPQSCVRGSPTLTKVLFYFLLMRGGGIQISGPLSARQRNAISMAFRLRADDSPTLNAYLVALLILGDLEQYCYGTLYFL